MAESVYRYLMTGKQRINALSFPSNSASIAHHNGMDRDFPYLFLAWGKRQERSRVKG